MKEVCKGGRCVVAKRRLWALKPNDLGWPPVSIVYWLWDPERVIYPLRVLVTSPVQWATDTKNCHEDEIISELKHWAQRLYMASIQQRYVWKVEDDSHSFWVAVARTKWFIIHEVGLGLQWAGRNKDQWQLGDSYTLQGKSHWGRSQKRDPGKESRLRVVERGFHDGSQAREELLGKTVQFNADV